MSDTAPTIDDLLNSYSRTLVARVQLREFESWGGIMVDAFRKQIAEHEQLEASYLKRLAEIRRTRGSGAGD